MSGRKAAFIAILAILVLVGASSLACSASQSTTTSLPGGAVTTTVTLAPGAAPSSNSLLETQLKTTEDTPKEYVDAIERGRPVVLLFYVTGSVEDANVLASLKQLQPSFNQYVFLFYDYKTPSAYGDLSTLLKVEYPPEVVLVDGTGTIKMIWNGYVDQGTLNQGLVNLGQASIPATAA